MFYKHSVELEVWSLWACSSCCTKISLKWSVVFNCCIWDGIHLDQILLVPECWKVRGLLICIVATSHGTNFLWNLVQTLYYIGMSFMQKKIIHGISVSSNKGFCCRGQNIAFPMCGMHYWGAHEWLSPCGHILSNLQLATSALDHPWLKPVCSVCKFSPMDWKNP